MRSRLVSCALFLCAAGCGGVQHVQLYEGAKLPDDQVTVFYTNPELEVTVDRQYSVPEDEIAKIHRLELPPGNHAVEVKCRYPEGPIKLSPQISLLLDGEAGHAYTARVQFGKNAQGVPNCKAKMFDITGQSGAEKIHSY
jgi:hypothetical protein